MRLAIGNGRSRETNGRSWQDSEGDRVEKHMREIVIELIVAGEQQYRDGLIRHREWLIRYKAELEETERQRKLEEERKRNSTGRCFRCHERRRLQDGQGVRPPIVYTTPALWEADAV